jgi:hypothetical protein
MEDANEDDLIMYEESKEIKETIWKIWDHLNDKEIVTKLLLDSSLLKELEKVKSSSLLNLKDNKASNIANNSSSKDKIEQKGKIYYK